MSERVTGYLLLVLGLTIMLIATLSMVFVFTKKAEPIQLFNLKGISIDSAALAPQVDVSSIPGMKKPESKPIEIIPGDMLNNSANIFAHLALMGFLLSVGSKVASLGVNLLRPIVVKTSQKNVSLETVS